MVQDSMVSLDAASFVGVSWVWCGVVDYKGVLILYFAVDSAYSVRVW